MTASFNALPARNFGCLQAAILIVAPVCGLRPVVAARFLTSNVPKPTKVTLLPFFKDFVTQATKESTALAASVFEKPPFLQFLQSIHFYSR